MHRCIQHTGNIQFRNNSRVNTEWVQSIIAFLFLLIFTFAIQFWEAVEKPTIPIPLSDIWRVQTRVRMHKEQMLTASFYVIIGLCLRLRNLFQDVHLYWCEVLFFFFFRRVVICLLIMLFLCHAMWWFDVLLFVQSFLSLLIRAVLQMYDKIFYLHQI